MTLVNFYGVNATTNVNPTLYKVLVKLLEKTVELNKNSMVFSNSTELLKELDDFMWTNSNWLPHALNSDNYKDKQPILLSNELKNYNKFSYLFVIDSSDFKVLPELEKICIIFNLNQIESMAFFEDQWKALQKAGFILKYFKQDKEGKFQNAML